MRMYSRIRGDRRSADHLRKRSQVVAIHLGSHRINRPELASNLPPMRPKRVAHALAVPGLHADDDGLLSIRTPLLHCVPQRGVELVMADLLAPNRFGPWKGDDYRDKSDSKAVAGNHGRCQSNPTATVGRRLKSDGK